jgi:beta-phosphoglucomutase
MTIKAILFDLDGVLVDACDWHYLALNKSLLNVSGVEIDEESHKTTFNGLPTKRKLEILAKNGEIQEYQIDQIWKLKQKYTIETINENAQPDPSKILLYHQLGCRNIKKACVTNSISETATLMLDRTGQIKLLEFVISNEDVKNNKPHPEPYVTAMVKLGALPEETLIVEDSEKGMQSALGTGAHVLKVNNATEVTWDRISEIISSIDEEFEYTWVEEKE